MRVKSAVVVLGMLLGAERSFAQAQPYPPPPPPQPGYPPQQPYPQPAPQPQQPYPQPQQPYPQPAPQPQQPYPPPGYPPTGYGQYPSPPPQYALPPEPETRLRRSGFAIGVAIGGGGVRFDAGSHSGLALTFDIGASLNQQMALMFDYSMVTYAVDEFNESHAIIGGVAQLFFARFLWAKAGLGMGRLSQSDQFGNRTDSTENSLAVILGLGAEVVQTTAGFALDLQLRFAGSSYKDAGLTTNTALLVGFNFY
jgi:hypothetical protein